MIDNNTRRTLTKYGVAQSSRARFPRTALGNWIPLPTLLAKELLFGAAGPAAES